MAHAAKLALASVEFFIDGVRCFRVYYRSPNDTTIRESCYQQDIGWFVRGDGVVTRQAKKGSPLTAIRMCWEDGSIEIIVLYLDARDNICKVGCYATAGLEDPWTLKILRFNDHESLNILPETQ
jgi:hypothetical protein